MSIKKINKKYKLQRKGKQVSAVFRSPVACFLALLLFIKYKLSALIRNSEIKNQEISNKKLTYVLGLSPWKSFISDWFPDRELVFLKTNISFLELLSKIGFVRLIKKDYEIFQWGFKVGDDIVKGVKFLGVKRWVMEDGFIRSIGLGSTKTPPFSLTLDSRTAYFDARYESDLELILKNYDFKSDPELMSRAASFKDRLIKSGLSKYNNPGHFSVEEVYGVKDKKRVLVIGQVEDDASIQFGCQKSLNNNDLVMMAALENPDAQIIYKPHPDVLHGHRVAVSNPDDVKGFALVLEDINVPLSESFKSIDHVYTITSQAGFEALLRGIKVTTIGCPFYSGWGLTDDRQVNERRNRSLTVDEVFAASYLLYPKYFDPINKNPISAEKALEILFYFKEKNKSRICDQQSEFPQEYRSPANKISDVNVYMDFRKKIIDLESEFLKENLF